MKAIRIYAHNTTPLIGKVSEPKISADQVLIRVQAVALNPLDKHIVSGFAANFFPIAFPFTPGSDFAGIIERIGEAVTEWAPGDPVIAWADPLNSGGLAELAVVPATACVALPPHLSAAEGAGIPTAASTAWHALFSVAEIQAGETILIHAGVGGVGSFAIQFAHTAGAKVIATASGDGLTLARNLGASQVIDYKIQDFTSEVAGVDVVLDLIGGETQIRSFDVLRAGGRLISTVAPPDEVIAHKKGVSACMMVVKPYCNRLDEVTSAITTKGIKVLIDSITPLEAFESAWTRLHSGIARGKIIVSIP